MPTSYCFFFIVSRLFPFVTTQSSNWYGKLSLFFVYSTANFEVAQGGFPSRFLPRIFPAAPNQHRLFCDLRQEPGNTAPPPFPQCAFPHPLQNRVPRVQVLLPLPIHLSPGSAKIAWPGAFSCLCLVGHGLLNPALCCIRCCPPASVLNRFLPLFSPPAPKTHPVSPFSGFSGCVSLFFAVLAAKFSACFLCILPHSVYRLKPSVIPCRREVSFLT